MWPVCTARALSDSRTGRDRLGYHTELTRSVWRGMKQTALKRTAIRKVSEKTAKANADLHKLVAYLAEHRAKRLCEIRATPVCQGRNYHPRWPGLSGHHVIKRSRGRVDTAGNIIIGCPDCHNHTKYGDGTPLSIIELLTIINRQNKKYGISGDLDGSQLQR